MNDRTSPITAGTIGFFGSGQLGRMGAMAARAMGYSVAVYSPDSNTPAGAIADREWSASYRDLDAVARFAESVDVVAVEFENVDVDAIKTAERHVPVRPSSNVLFVTQNRRREKEFLRGRGFPVGEYRFVENRESFQSAVEELGAPSILKTAELGYDGRGQFLLDRVDQLDEAWRAVGERPSVLEKFVPFVAELSVVGARSSAGEYADFGVFENLHRRGILDLTCSPARVDAVVAERAASLTRSILESLAVVGLTCVELFLLADGAILVNELAPRTHNSGHLTIEAFEVSQFERQIRAVCNLPLGSTERHRPAAMANLLGDIWADGEPSWDRALAVPGVSLHRYGKVNPRPGRKMGHLTCLADDVDEAIARVKEARRRLTGDA